METHRKQLILEACHDNLIGGCHFGRDKTVDKVSSRFFWKGIHKDVEKWVSSTFASTHFCVYIAVLLYFIIINYKQVQHCEVCQRSKRKFDHPAPCLHPIPVSDTWCKVGIDLIELPVTSSGNRYCITLTDYFSKWAEAQPIPTKEAIHVATFLYKMIMRHGCPEEIVSDQVYVTI